MPAPTAYISQTPQTYHTPPYPIAQQNKARGGFKIVLITLAIIFALGIASVIGAVFFVRSKVQQVRRGLPNLPKISKTTDPISPDKLGAPIYPGAEQGDAISGDGGPFSGTVVEYTTTDEMGKVAEFYRNYYRGKEEYQFREVNSKDSDTGERSVTFTVTTNGQGRVIVITPDDKNNKLTKIVMIGGSMAPPVPKNGGARVPPDADFPPPPPPPAPHVAPPGR